MGSALDGGDVGSNPTAVISRLRAAFCLVWILLILTLAKKAPQLSPIGVNRGAFSLR